MTVEIVKPVDPLLFDFGIGFKNAGERVAAEQDRRRRLVVRALPYHHGFLDDILRSILPNDLILLGAETGAGKTDAVTGIAEANAADGRNVYYFALEAEEDEIERRIKYKRTAKIARERGLPFCDHMNYPDWYHGRYDAVLGTLSREVDELIAKDLSHLHTYYRGSKFDRSDIKRLFLAVQNGADLIILDHLHYVDTDDENENRAQRDTMKMMRDVALGMGRPVIVVVHLRKKGNGFRRSLVPDIDSIHGASDISKIATTAIILAPCHVIDTGHYAMRNTFVQVVKDRMGGVTGLAAVCTYDVRQRAYGEAYALGRIHDAGEHWTELEGNKRPGWAKRARALGGSIVTTVPQNTGRKGKQ